MKSFLKQVLAILVALTIFGIGGCVFFAFAFHSTVNEFRAKQQAEKEAEEEAEKQRIIQFNKDFLEMHNEMRNHPISRRPQN